jgi:hypothetical protein
MVNWMLMKKRPDYVNKRLKKVSYEELKRVLRELELKHEKDRREQMEALNRALSDGFRCGPWSPRE